MENESETAIEWMAEKRIRPQQKKTLTTTHAYSNEKPTTTTTTLQREVATATATADRYIPSIHLSWLLSKETPSTPHCYYC